MRHPPHYRICPDTAGSQRSLRDCFSRSPSLPGKPTGHATPTGICSVTHQSVWTPERGRDPLQDTLSGVQRTDLTKPHRL